MVKKMSKKFFALFLTLAIVMSLMPALTIFASAATITEDFESYPYAHWASSASGTTWGNLKIYTQDMGIIFIHGADEGAGTANGANSISANAGSSSSWLKFEQKDGLTFSLSSLALGNPNTTFGSQYVTVQGFCSGDADNNPTYTKSALSWSTTTMNTTTFTSWDNLVYVKIVEPNMGSGDITYIASYLDDIVLKNVGGTDYTATINTKVDDTATDATGSVELKQSGTTKATATKSATGVYTASVADGTYDVFINSVDTGTDIVISGASNSATVNYYTVSFAVTNAGTASGSTVSAIAGGTAISSGAKVLSGKVVEINAVGAGSTSYSYLWSGTGTSGQTTAALNIASLSTAVNATCTVTGSTAPTVTMASQSVEGGANVTVQSSATGTVYLVSSSLADTAVDSEAELDALVTANLATKVAIASANTNTTILAPAAEGTYTAIGVSSGGSVSTKSTALVTVDNTAPTISSGTLAGSNQYIDITFSEGVFGAADGITALDAAKLSITFTKNGGTATNAVISSVKKADNAVEGSATALAGGETTVRVFLTITGTPNGLESIEVKPANAASIYDKAGNAMSAAQTTGVKALNVPVISSISPTSGPTAGGTTVTITGTNFTGATAVKFGTTAASSFTVNSSTQITVTSPAGSGTVDITVTTAGGTSAVGAADQFTYIAAPTVTNIVPSAGSLAGGTTVTITGTNFTGATAVTIGGTAATGVTVVDSTTIIATTPAGTAGAQNVVVTTPGGPGTGAGLFTYYSPTYTVTYNGNSNTGGSVPTDVTSYNNGNTVTVLGNTGSLVRTGYTFAGWNTAADGCGTSYSGGATFAMGSSNVTLYAKWTCTVTYNGNSNTGGSVPTDATSYLNIAIVTVLGNSGSLVRTGYTFAGWNTAANGSGTGYTGGNTFAIGAGNVTLYAQWTPVDYSVTYNGNTNTGGAVSTDANAYHITDTVTVLGNTGTLVKTGYTFAGWNTAANGSGTGYSGSATFAMGSSNVTLYAQWTENTYTVTYSGNSNTGGAVPTDATSYHNTDSVTVLGNTGALVRTGYTFAGWNTAANGSGTGYTGGNTFAIGAGNVTLYAQWTPNDYTVTYNGNTNTGGAVPTDANAYHITDTVTVLGNTGILVKTGYTFAGWNTAANGSGTSYSGGATFAMGSSNVTLYAQWTVNGAAATPPPATNTTVIVDGQNINAGTTTTTTNTDGQTQTTITVDPDKLNDVLNKQGDGATVTIPVSTDSAVAVGVLTGQTVKNMEQKEAVLEIKTETVTYTLPASQINIDDVSAQIGSQVALKDIKVSVSIAEPPADTVKIVENTASKGNYQIVVKPVEFEITCTSGGKTVDVSKFNGYVERTVAIPDGVDPSKITTGIVLNSDGTFSHVPTTIVAINGKYFAKINSLTNSTYSVIWNPVTFTDVANHWSKNAVNDMGSRMVVTGMGNGTYEPDRSITRAEFAAIVVRAMGLKKGTTESAFSDVTASDWFNGYVDTATEYSLITGYDSASYGPNDTITREQAMAILARAIKLTGLSVSLTDSETTALLANYTDGATVSAYARTNAASCLKAGIITGSSATTLSPKSYVTRAEVAVMVQRLLQKSGLI